MMGKNESHQRLDYIFRVNFASADEILVMTSLSSRQRQQQPNEEKINIAIIWRMSLMLLHFRAFLHWSELNSGKCIQKWLPRMDRVFLPASKLNFFSLISLSSVLFNANVAFFPS